MKRLLEASLSWQLLRYYQAAIVNTIFGYSVYVLFVRVIHDRYYAQIISHLLGMCFNYLTYSRHVFRSPGSKINFVLAYLLTGILNLLILYAVSFAIASPYIAGLVATLITSLVSFLLLKFHVFGRARRA